MKVNQLYCGDSLKLIDKLNHQPKLIILHPPDLAETPYTLEEYREFLKTIYTRSFNKLHKNGVLVSINTDRKMDGFIYTKHIDILNFMPVKPFNYKILAKSLKTNLYVPTFSHILFFRKSKKITNNKVKEFYPDVWLIKTDKIPNYPAKDTFASEFARRVILNFTNKNDLVLDPFLGSGKTAKIAKDWGCNYIGFDIEKKNIKLAKKYIGG